MRHLYTFIHWLLLPVLLLRLLWRARRWPELRERLAERFGGGQPFADRPRIWIHAVSVGEVSAVAPLVKRLLAAHPDHAVLVTTTTPTGAQQVRRLLGNAVEHRFLPFDLPFAAKGFFANARPRLGVVVETEIWPNLYTACADAGVPLALVNARLSASSMRGYRRIGALTRGTLGVVARFCARSRADAEALRSLGADPGRIEVTGNLKFVFPDASEIAAAGARLRQAFGERPVWIAASTHEGEESMVLAAHRRVLESCPQTLLIVAPRHPERADGIERLIQSAGFKALRWSVISPSPPAPLPAGELESVLLVDTLGELPAFYAASDVAFVGGSLVPHGGHNLLEPAALGVPVLSGPHLFNFEDVVAVLREADGLVDVRDADDLAACVAELLADPAARESLGARARAVVEKNGGALERTLAVLKALLPEKRGQYPFLKK